MSIQLVDVRLRGRTRARLLGINVKFVPGTVYGLVGPNGAGKSSLMAVMAGLARPTRGNVRRIFEQPVVIGAVLSENGLHPGRTVSETLRLRAAYVGASAAQVDASLRTSGLEGAARCRVGALSLGMKMRLAVAAALIGGPSVVLLDEPMNGLDPNGIAWVRAVVRDLRAKGAIVVVSSHLLSELEAMIDVAVVMSGGRIARVQDMELGEQDRCVIEVSDAAAMIAAMADVGVVGHRRGDKLVVEATAPDAARIAVSRGIDVLALAPAIVDLEALYSETSVGEHIAEVAG